MADAFCLLGRLKISEKSSERSLGDAIPSVGAMVLISDVNKEVEIA
jgi:hypothetical protein